MDYFVEADEKQFSGMGSSCVPQEWQTAAAAVIIISYNHHHQAEWQTSLPHSIYSS